MEIGKCPKHPNYKGIRETKRDCKRCAIIYKNKSNSIDKIGKFPSLTTPNKRYSIHHILAEMSCIMIFGKLPPYFWNKNSKCSIKIKNHYKKILMGSIKWSKKSYDRPVYGNNPIENIRKSLYYLVTRYELEEKARENHNKVFVKSEEKSEEEKIDKTFFEVNKKKNKFESLKELGENDGG